MGIETERLSMRDVEEDNVRSLNLCKRLGMRFEGCMIDFISFDDTPKYDNTCINAVLRSQ